MIPYANASMSGLILAEITWIRHLISLFTKCFHTLPCCIAYNTPDAFPVLYGEYSTDLPFDPPTQSYI